jgi:hypothetical protein
MENNHVVQLIDGNFDLASAKEIILTMIDKKIEYHEMNSFRSLVTSNLNNANIESKIKELKLTKQRFIDYLNAAPTGKFKISAAINIEAF